MGPSACLLWSAPAMCRWSPDSPAEGASCKQKNMTEDAMKNTTEALELLGCTADNIINIRASYIKRLCSILHTVQFGVQLRDALQVMSLVFVSRSNLASVSIVAILSPILFVAALGALAATSAAAASHTAGTANTVSVT